MSAREGSLGAPIRHSIDWKAAEYTDETALNTELERVFDTCHGCRRCFSLCNAFPTLVRCSWMNRSLGELDARREGGLSRASSSTATSATCVTCPSVPTSRRTSGTSTFPHLMLRAKVNAIQQERRNSGSAIRYLSATDAVGRIAGIPVVAQTVNAVNASKLGRKLVEKTLGVASEAPLPKYFSRSARSQLSDHIGGVVNSAQAAGRTRGRVGLFATCYGNRNAPGVVRDLVAVFEHNGISVVLPSKENCCGMPKLELGDLESVAALKDKNIDELYQLVLDGWDLTACIPSCVLMFKQELPLLFPDDEKVKTVADAFFDPFDYLMQRHKEGLLKTDFKQELGSVSYQVPCHLRVQNIGLKTRDVLELIPNTTVKAIERCSGHDGTYAVKTEYHAIANKIARPVARQVDAAKAEHFTSDCPMAAEQIANVAESAVATHPIELLRRAYGI